VSFESKDSSRIRKTRAQQACLFNDARVGRKGILVRLPSVADSLADPFLNIDERGHEDSE
jgi:hypothetical protein